MTQWNLHRGFKCKQCDNDKPLELVAYDGIGLCSGCTTILPAGMVAGCANCKAVVCLVCIDNGDRLLDFLDLWAGLQEMQLHWQ